MLVCELTSNWDCLEKLVCMQLSTCVVRLTALFQCTHASVQCKCKLAYRVQAASQQEGSLSRLLDIPCRSAQCPRLCFLRTGSGGLTGCLEPDNTAELVTSIFTSSGQRCAYLCSSWHRSARPGNFYGWVAKSDAPTYAEGGHPVAHGTLL